MTERHQNEAQGLEPSARNRLPSCIPDTRSRSLAISLRTGPQTSQATSRAAFRVASPVRSMRKYHLGYLSIKALTCMFASDGRSGPLHG